MKQLSSATELYRESPSLDDVLHSTPASSTSLLDRVIDAEPQQPPAEEVKPLTITVQSPWLAMTYGKFFARERVVLDYRSFVDCYFFECELVHTRGCGFAVQRCIDQGSRLTRINP